MIDPKQPDQESGDIIPLEEMDAEGDTENLDKNDDLPMGETEE